MVRSFVDARIRPEIADWFDRGTLPARELARELGELGVLGMHLEGYGCAGTSAVAYGLACLELEAGDSGIRSLVSVQGSLAMFAIHAFGPRSTSSSGFPAWPPARRSAASGSRRRTSAPTRRECAPTPSAMVTTALNGSKMWITNGNIADVAVVWRAPMTASVDSLSPPTPPVRCQRDPPEDVPARLGHQRVGPRGRATARGRGAARRRGPTRPAVMPERGAVRDRFGTLGAARDSLQTAIDYSIDREQFDKPIAGYQLTQKKLADMTLELGKGMLLALHLGRLKDQHVITPEQVSLGKLNNARESLAIARECRSILGATASRWNTRSSGT